MFDLEVVTVRVRLITLARILFPLAITQLLISFEHIEVTIKLQDVQRNFQVS